MSPPFEELTKPVGPDLRDRAWSHQLLDAFQRAVKANNVETKRRILEVNHRNRILLDAVQRALETNDVLTKRHTS